MESRLVIDLLKKQGEMPSQVDELLSLIKAADPSLLTGVVVAVLAVALLGASSIFGPWLSL